VIIAQITDTHARPPGVLAYGSIDTNAMLRSAAAAVGRLDPAPDCVIATGDLADGGLQEEYGEIADALAQLPMPVFAIPGNHDRREAMRTSRLARHCPVDPRSEFLQYVVDDFPVRLIALDTVVAGETSGEICAAREAWFARALANGKGRPTLVFMHHPPFRTGVPAMDPMMCRIAPSFAELVSRHPEIERIVTGHYHRPIVVRWAGTIGFVAPSTAHQVVLDLRESEPTRWALEPPGFALHVYRDGVGMVSHVVPIGDFGPAREFDLPPEYPGRR